MLGKYEYGFGQTEAMRDRAAAENGLDRQSPRARKALARTCDDDFGIDLPHGFDDRLCGSGNPAGGFEQGLSDLPARMHRCSSSLGCQQQSAGL